MHPITITLHERLDDDLLTELTRLEAGVFESPLPREAFERALADKSDLIILLGENESETCAYKIGYREQAEVFFSWSGGVLPAYRRRGIATQLLREQHRIALSRGFRWVRTHTKNKYREMLLLNLEVGFFVTGTYHRLGETDPGIILELPLR